MTPARRVWLLTAGAFVLYGGVAAAVNAGHGLRAALTALGVQGLSSAVATFTTSLLIEFTHGAWTRRHGPTAGAFAVAVAAGILPAMGQHLALNLLAGTPELWATLALPLVAVLIYAILYTTAAHRRARRARGAAP